MKTLSVLLMCGILVSLFAGITSASDDSDYGGYEKRGNHKTEFYGVIESMPENGYEGTWLINGKEIIVSKDTYIKEKHGKASIGVSVEVKGHYSGNKLNAYKIEVAEGNKHKKGSYPGKFYGLIEALPQDGREGIWVVNGREILVTRDTRIKEKYGKTSVGAFVEVEGDYSGTRFVSYEIEVKGNKKNQSHGSYNSKFYGVIESIPDDGYEGIWIIDGREVLVNKDTIIKEILGKVSEGASVKVKGKRENNTTTANEIEVKGNRR